MTPTKRGKQGMSMRLSYLIIMYYLCVREKTNNTWRKSRTGLVFSVHGRTKLLEDSPTRCPLCVSSCWSYDNCSSGHSLRQHFVPYLAARVRAYLHRRGSAAQGAALLPTPIVLFCVDRVELTRCMMEKQGYARQNAHWRHWIISS